MRKTLAVGLSALLLAWGAIYFHNQVTLMAPLGTGEGGETRKPSVAGVLQVLRVTPFGASAIVLDRSEAEIAIGMTGRITAKMP